MREGPRARGEGVGERGSMNEGVGRVGARMADEWPGTR